MAKSDRRYQNAPISVHREILARQLQYSADCRGISTHANRQLQKREERNEPLVSVVIPAYNAERFIATTLQSVLSQTYQNLEVIVVDDGSGDRTVEIVDSIAQKDRRVVMLQQPNSGVAAARNLAIANSTGEFIAPIDADDIWYPENIEKQVRCFERSDFDVGLVYSWSVDIDENDCLQKEARTSHIEGRVYQTLMLHNFMGNASCSLIRRTCLEKVGNYSTQLKEQNAQGGEDWELYLRVAEQYKFRVVPEILVGYRKFAGSMSSNYIAMAKSHYLIWQSIRQKYSKIPQIIYQLSSSSFHMYLARNSNQNGDYKSTLFLLYRALRSDFFSPFLRFGFYQLLMTSCWQLIAESIVFWNRQKPSLLKSDTSEAKSFEVPFAPTNQKITTRIKTLVENILHRSIPTIFGTTQSWK